MTIPSTPAKGKTLADSASDIQYPWRRPPRGGKKSSTPGGYGWIHKTQGYWYATHPVTRKQVHEHRLVWEWHNGPIPDGYHVHHLNKDRKDNRIENLALVSSRQHNRLYHSSWVVQPDGSMKKRCTSCQKTLPGSSFRPVRNGRSVHPYCRACESRKALEHQRSKRNGIGGGA